MCAHWPQGAEPKPLNCATDHIMMLIAEKGINCDLFPTTVLNMELTERADRVQRTFSRRPVVLLHCPSAPYIWTKVCLPLGWLHDACHSGQILRLDVFLLCAEENQNIICVAALGTFILNDLMVHICLTLLCLSTF